MRESYIYVIEMREILFHANCFGKFVFGHKFFFKDDFFDRATAFVRFFYNLSTLIVADI